MVMNVGNINPIFAKQTVGNNKTFKGNTSNNSITSIPNVTPDFQVKVPTAYTKLGVKVLSNGLEIHSYKLSNGHKVTIIPMEDSPTIVKNYVNVGSFNETNNIKGISHFLEHMAFNGTNGENGHIKLGIGDSFKKIDEMGGWANASTNYAITDYVNSTPQLSDGDVEKQIQVIAAMTEDLALTDEMIEKEKNAVCSEINMILDNPETIAMDQTVRTLYGIKNPADEMVGGSVDIIQNLTRKDVKDYYDKYYTPDNMNLVITGNVEPDEIINIVAKNFNSQKKSTGKRFDEPTNMLKKTVRKDFECDKAKSTEIVLGFAGPQNCDARENILCNVISSYMYTSNVGLKSVLKEYNASYMLGNEKISTKTNANQFIYLTTSCADKNSEEVLATLLNIINNIPNINEEKLELIKKDMRKGMQDALENSAVVNNSVGKAILNNSFEAISDFDTILDSITVDDVNNAIKKYFDVNKTAITLVHPKRTEDISFKGKKREPVNMEKVIYQKLDNNYNVGLYETKNNNINYNLTLSVNTPIKSKPATGILLSSMLTMGSGGFTENELDEFKENNSIWGFILSSNTSISVHGDSSIDDFDKMTNLLEKMLYEPNLTQQNLDKAKEMLKDDYSRKQDTSASLYYDFEAGNNPYEYTNEEIKQSIDDVTLDDIKEYYSYLLNNSKGVVTANIPTESKSEVKNKVLDFTSSLPFVKNLEYESLNLYKQNENVKVLTKENNNSQADIAETFTYLHDGTPKETVTAEIMNSILSASSIGLFDVLREKEHLAYSVHSMSNKHGNRGQLTCHILTTTDNKEINEYSYENLKKSIEGFNRQIRELKSGKFTDKDFENAKLYVKAILLDNEGTQSKLNNLEKGLDSKYSIDYVNKLYKEVDAITKDDVVNYAEKVFKNPPVYSIVASKDTLEYNKEYLQSLNS